MPNSNSSVFVEEWANQDHKDSTKYVDKDEDKYNKLVEVAKGIANIKSQRATQEERKRCSQSVKTLSLVWLQKWLTMCLTWRFPLNPQHIFLIFSKDIQDTSRWRSDNFKQYYPIFSCAQRERVRFQHGLFVYGCPVQFLLLFHNNERLTNRNWGRPQLFPGRNRDNQLSGKPRVAPNKPSGQQNDRREKKKKLTMTPVFFWNAVRKNNGMATLGERTQTMPLKESVCEKTKFSRIAIRVFWRLQVRHRQQSLFASSRANSDIVFWAEDVNPIVDGEYSRKVGGIESAKTPCRALNVQFRVH